MKYLFCALLLTFALASGLFAQSDWHTYPVRSIAEIIALHPPEATESADIIISAQPFPSKTTATYTGKRRPVGEHTKNFIGLWVETRGVPKENAQQLVEEFLFREKDKEYWIPVLKKVAPVFVGELKEGDEVVIYYFFLGGYNPKKLREKSTLKDKSTTPVEDKIEWVFAVEAFEKSAYRRQPLVAAIDKNLEKSSGKIDFLIDSRQVKSKSKVTYTGEIRAVSDRKRLFLERWLEKIDAPAPVVELFLQEARFRDGDKDYWLPVRKSILDEMKRRYQKGDGVEIHTILAGAIPQADAFDWIFIVGEFTR
ncbi:MAG TPA: hypothetical protein VK400_20890 [Pyrinomonadaceae bacterium]|nr:hypothetical protein [Pyrinomonadaceae bacterium]